MSIDADSEYRPPHRPTEGPNGYRDLTGQQFGLYTVIRRAGLSKSKNPTWLVVCGGCGAQKVIQGSTLKAGAKKCRACSLAEIGGKLRGSEAAKSHRANLSAPIWGKVCKTCRRKFLGTARQTFCSPACRLKRRVEPPE